MDIALAARLTVGTVLAVAGIRKMLPGARPQLVLAIRNYGIAPDRIIGVLAWTLPWLELSTGALMAAGVLLTPASVCAGVLLVSFSGAVAWHTWRGRSFSCGCGAGGAVRWSLAVRDLGLGLLSAGVAVYPHDALAIWAGPAWFKADPSGWLTLVPVPMTMLLLVISRRLIALGLPLISGSAASAAPSGETD